MRPKILCALLIFAAGCTHVQLQIGTVNQASTMTDLLYQQVLDNIAMFVDNPYAIPWQLTPIVGNVQVQDTAQASPQFTFAPTGRSLTSVLGLQGSRQLQEGWTLAPAVYNTISSSGWGGQFGYFTKKYKPHLVIEEVQHAYRVIIGAEPPDTDLEKERNLGPGWYQIGSKKDVPKNACYVGHYCKRYVWVCPDGLKGLADASIAMLELTHVSIQGAGAFGAAPGVPSSPLPIAIPSTPAIVPPPAFSPPLFPR